MPSCPALCNRLLGLMLALIILFPGSARAAIDEQGAAHLKTIFEKMLVEQKDNISAQGGTLDLDGELQVEPASTYYAVTLPHMTVVNGDGSYTEIGIISMNALPTQNTGEWRMTMAIPTPIRQFNKDRKETYAFTMGQQNFAGVFHENLLNFTQMQGQYKNIDVKAADKSYTTHIDQVTLVYDLKQEANSNWSGPAKFTVDGVQINDSAGSTVKIGSINSVMTFYDYSFAEATEYQRQIAELAKSADFGKPETNAKIGALLNNLMTKVWDGFDTSTTLQNIQISNPMAQSNSVSEMNVKEAGINLGLKGFRSQNITLTFKLNYKDFGFTPKATNFNATLPNTGALDIEIQNIPFDDIAKLASSTMQTAQQTPEAASIVALSSLASLPRILGEKGAHINVKSLSASNETYDASFTGDATASPDAARVVSGQGQLTIGGLDELAASVNKQMEDPALSTLEKEKLQKIAGTIATLQLAGQQGTNTAGKPARIYNFELKKDGKILLNGADMSTFLQKN